MPQVPNIPDGGNGSEDTNNPSSEGFTSFFTTTHSSNNGSSSDGDKKRSTESGASKNDQIGRKEDTGDSSNKQEGSSDGSAHAPRVRINVPHGASRRISKELMAEAQANESTMSSGSSLQNMQVRPYQDIPRMVTESSSGANTNSASNSGGSLGNNMSSMSNLGSSGSGNEKNSSEEGRGAGSSEDVTTKDLDRGDGCNDASDEADLLAGQKDMKAGHDVVDLQDMSGRLRADLDMENPTRERKLLDKKRKRIEMRREYEAQQQSESSENAETNQTDDLLRPGKSYTLEQVLQFSNIPR